jgi:hypothetical protein
MRTGRMKKRRYSNEFKITTVKSNVSALMKPTYVVRLMFEWSGGCLWCGNDAARKKFDVGPIEGVLPLSEATRAELVELSEWHDGALNWASPQDPSPWSAEEFQRFEVAAQDIKSKLERELGPEFEIVYVRLGDAST